MTESISINPLQLQMAIEDEYRRLGHTIGWRLLTCPIDNIKTSKTALISINPGGYHREEPSVSSERGSAYCIESWKGNVAGEESLQRQVKRMCEILQTHPDQILSGYLVPFRSPNWNQLPEKAQSLQFGLGLWKMLLSESQIGTIIAFGKEAGALLAAHFNYFHNSQVQAGWGTQTIDIYCGPRQNRLIALPHLSRFKLFGRPPSERAFAEALSRCC